MLAIVLRGSPCGLQTRLDGFFEEIGHKEGTVSKQAFSKRRAKLAPEVVEESFRITAKALSECGGIELFKGKYRLCAMDGSVVALDNADELLAHFGGSGRNKDCASATASFCYDPLNNTILDGGLYPYGFSEREAARKHFGRVSELALPEGASNLYLADRGYPSKELFAEMLDGGMRFLMRTRRKFDAGFDVVEKEGPVEFLHGGRAYSVRVLKVTLDSGEKETLATNLGEEDLAYDEAGELYFKRWCIETKFESLKGKLELENMSGRRVVTTYQDFWAKLDLANTVAALEFATDAAIEEKTAGSGNKYRQITNENRLIAKFTSRYVELLANRDPAARMRLFDELVADIAKRPVEVKPGRKFERKAPRKKRFCDRHKRILR